MKLVNEYAAKIGYAIGVMEGLKVMGEIAPAARDSVTLAIERLRSIDLLLLQQDDASSEKET